MQRTCKLYIERPLSRFEPGTFLLWGNSANHQATVLPNWITTFKETKLIYIEDFFYLSSYPENKRTRKSLESKLTRVKFNSSAALYPSSRVVKSALICQDGIVCRSSECGISHWKAHHTDLIHTTTTVTSSHSWNLVFGFSCSLSKNWCVSVW